MCSGKPSAITHGNISFAIPAPVARGPRAVAPLNAPDAPHLPHSRTPSPEDAVLADLLGRIPTIQQGCEDEVTHALHLKMFKQHGTRAPSPNHPSVANGTSFALTHPPYWVSRKY